MQPGIPEAINHRDPYMSQLAQCGV
jgi:hypothetical protein